MEQASGQIHPLRSHRSLADAVTNAVARSQAYLWDQQYPDGHWCAELTGDTILESELILLMTFLGREKDAVCRKAAEHLRRQQLEGSAWSIYPGGPPEVSASVKAYFALKLLGESPDAPHMRRARDAVRDLGGIGATNTYTKIYLAMFGQHPWSECPAVPPEMLLLPRWFFVNVHDMSAWSRGIFVPLSIIWAHKPVRPIPREARIDELVVPGAPRADARFDGNRAYGAMFRALDRALKGLERARIRPLRRVALRRAEAWITARVAGSDGLQAIFPAFVNAALAYRCLGYPDDHPLVEDQLAALRRHIIEDAATARVQPCRSPVWDTAQTLDALLSAGADPGADDVVRGASWLCDREARVEGDWRYGMSRERRVAPSGWYFEYRNELYPDCDDTAEVLAVLARVKPRDEQQQRRFARARRRGLRWLLAMQNDDGGWGAFDRNCNKGLLEHVPFADHNAMLDPSWEDITGRVLETLALEGFERTDPVVDRAVEFLKSRQNPEGPWYGRWGCNYLYGTWLVLAGLQKIGEDLRQLRYQRAARWICQQQNPDGGWGESLASYDDPTEKGVGESTAAQTAWALLALIASGRGDSQQVRRGVDYLVANQRDGTWHDTRWTGTGFPRVFYLGYGYYDDYFPLKALAAYRDQIGAARRPGRAPVTELTKR